jgi:hypothetical protein
MATKNQQGKIDPVHGAQDGFLYVRGLEDHALENYLQTYDAQMLGYKTSQGDSFTNVTMKIAFPQGTPKGNANLWAFFIVKAAHPSASKPRIDVRDGDGAVWAFVTWPIWNEVRYMESKNPEGRQSSEF